MGIYAVSFNDLKEYVTENFDEVWFIVRSLKNGLPTLYKSDGAVNTETDVYHVPQLSPSVELFHQYLQWKKDDEWDEETFQTKYVPQFLKEMLGEEQKTFLNILFKKGQTSNIAIVCFCPEEYLCHRSIILGLVQGAYLSLHMEQCYRRCEGQCNTLDDYSWYWYDYQKLKENAVAGHASTSTGDTSKTVCFTGRRPKDLYGYEHDKYIPLVDTLKTEIESLYHKGYTTFISGGAQGIDQLAFWAVNSLKKTGLPLKNIVYVPFKGQERQWKDTGLFSKAEYNCMLSNADEVKYLFNINPNNRGEVVKALYERNHAMVNDSDLVFGVTDNDWTNPSTKGGTAECLKFASGKNKNILVLNPFTMITFSNNVNNAYRH